MSAFGGKADIETGSQAFEHASAWQTVLVKALSILTRELPDAD
jgi:hypothetical protein